MAKYRLKTTINKNFKPVRFSRNGKPHHQIFLEIEPDEAADLSKVDKVDYVLHPTFKVRTRTVTNKSENFRFEIKAWGTFVVRVVVYESDGNRVEFNQDMRENWVEGYY